MYLKEIVPCFQLVGKILTFNQPRGTGAVMNLPTMISDAVRFILPIYRQNKAVERSSADVTSYDALKLDFEVVA